MSFLLLAAASVVASTVKPDAPAATSAVVQTQVSVRIVSAVRFTEEDWKASPNRKVYFIRDKAGAELRLRTIEFE